MQFLVQCNTGGIESDAGAQNLLNPTLQFLGYAHRTGGKPHSRAELARSEIRAQAE
jgi:hypothetical protein